MCSISKYILPIRNNGLYYIPWCAFSIVYVQIGYCLLVYTLYTYGIVPRIYRDETGYCLYINMVLYPGYIQVLVTLWEWQYTNCDII